MNKKSADVDRMTFEEWFKREYPLFEREGRGTTLKHQLHAAWEARQALDRDAVFVPLDLKMLALRAEQGELLNEFAGAEGYVEYDLRTKENGYVATVQDYHTAVFITYLWNWFRSLKREPSAAPQGWVPVSERLPMKTETVVFYSEGGTMLGNYSANEWWDRCEDWPPVRKVTHWMPLPPAPGASDE